MSILDLPTELIEHILISAAVYGIPSAIGAFSQTCKSAYNFVYNPKDHHLWREIYLSTFDDPRASGGGPGWSECASSKKNEEEFDWAGHFKQRIWAARHISRETSRSSSWTDWDPDWDLVTPVSVSNAKAFDTVACAVSSSLPCPPTIVLSFLPTADGATKNAPSSIYPLFPPLPPAIAGDTGNISVLDVPNASGRTFGQPMRAKNIAWFESVMSKGFPPRIAAIFSGDKWIGGLAGDNLDDDEFREMQTAGRIMAYTGFIPVSEPEPEPSNPRSPLSSPPLPPESATGPTAASPRAGSAGPSTNYMSTDNQLKRARRLARMRVYNMRYLSRDRHWGPFLQCIPKGRLAPRTPPDDDELLQPILDLFRTTPVTHQHQQDRNDDVGDDGEGQETEQDQIDGDGDVDLRAPEEESDSDGPPASQLRVDWAYLAAVRVVVEANLRESHSETHDLRGLFSLEGLRPGSAPWDASAYKQTAPAEESLDGCVKGKQKETVATMGWDWAGVTGMWKRCVCWMDYRDLILHNLSGEFEDPHLAEAVRIIGMRLRIKSYSPSRIPKYAHLPTIHIEGETTSALPDAPRKMEGTVCVIGDGSVRWTLYSSLEGAQTYEWVSEGIQVGGVASAMGVLGMWTGAQHERMDPLGPSWAWKVG